MASVFSDYDSGVSDIWAETSATPKDNLDFPRQYQGSDVARALDDELNYCRTLGGHRGPFESGNLNFSNSSCRQYYSCDNNQCNRCIYGYDPDYFPDSRRRNSLPPWMSPRTVVDVHRELMKIKVILRNTACENLCEAIKRISYVEDALNGLPDQYYTEMPIRCTLKPVPKKSDSSLSKLRVVRSTQTPLKSKSSLPKVQKKVSLTKSINRTPPPKNELMQLKSNPLDELQNRINEENRLSQIASAKSKTMQKYVKTLDTEIKNLEKQLDKRMMMRAKTAKYLDNQVYKKPPASKTK